MIRKAVGERVPVSVAQRMNDPAFADQVIEQEGFEFVTLARAFPADPDYVRKLIKARAHEFSRTTPVKAAVPLKAMVIGGGVAGMHATRSLGLGGHEVTLYEKTGQLGDNSTTCAKPCPNTGHWSTGWSLELAKTGVAVKLGLGFGVEDVRAADPDVVVVATGTGWSSLGRTVRSDHAAVRHLLGFGTPSRPVGGDSRHTRR